MISSAEQRFLKDAERLHTRIATGKLKREPLVERASGALLKKHPKVARFYQLTYGQGALRVERDDGRFETAVALCGDYVLKTDHRLKGPELWKLYMTLLRAEKGFGALKGALGLWPNFHQLEDRVEEHFYYQSVRKYPRNAKEDVRKPSLPMKWWSVPLCSTVPKE